MHVCHACGLTVPLGTGVHVIWEGIGTAAQSDVFMQYVDASIHQDPTIASIDVDCPRCQDKRKVKYIRYGKGLDYLYACAKCDGFWTRCKGGAPVLVTPRLLAK